MKYELDDLDLELIEQCREAVEYDYNGAPMKDVLDDDDFRWAVHLLVNIVNAEEQE